MRLLSIYCLLFFAVFMLVAKPFIGFEAIKKMGRSKNHIGVIVKAFTKRKQEYVEDSNFDVSTIYKRLANPVLALTSLFSVLLSTLFPSLFRKGSSITTSFLSFINLSIFPPAHRYLLSGKLTI